MIGHGVWIAVTSIQVFAPSMSKGPYLDVCFPIESGHLDLNYMSFL